MEKANVTKRVLLGSRDFGMLRLISGIGEHEDVCSARSG